MHYKKHLFSTFKHTFDPKSWFIHGLQKKIKKNKNT